MLLQSIPKIVELDVAKLERTIHFYEEFSPIFLDVNGNLKSEIIKDLFALKNLYIKSSIRISRTYNCLQFLIHFDCQSKKIIVATPQASQELALIKWYEQFREVHKDLGKQEMERIRALRDHVNLIVSTNIQESASCIEQLTISNELPDLLNNLEFAEIENDSQILTRELIEKIGEYKSTLFEKFTDFGLNLTANYALFRVHLLKFFAILPSLDYDQRGGEVKRVFLETIRRLLADSTQAKNAEIRGQNAPIPSWCFVTFFIILWSSKIIPATILASIIRFAVRFMAARFIAGETIGESSYQLKSLLEGNRGFTVDQLGELVVSEDEAEIYCQNVLKIINGMKEHVSAGEKNSAGIFKANVSVKVSALCSDFKPQDFDYTYEMVGPRLKKILTTARTEQVFLNVDAEHIHYRDLVFNIYKKVLLETPELADYGQTGIVLQGYLRDSYQHFRDILQLAKDRSLIMPVRIVKGAYWDAETIEGDAHNFPAPQFLNKEETDLNFRQLIHEMLANREYIQLIIASHNIQDHCWAETLRKKKFTNAPTIEHQCLHMTYEALSVGISKMGWPVRNYVPIGGLLVGMGYLVRRIMENSSQVGFLTMMRSHRMVDSFLPPQERHKRNKHTESLVFDPQISKLTSEFSNIYPVRLYAKDQLNDFNKTIHNFKNNGLGKNYRHPFEGDQKVSIYSSSDSKLCVGEITLANEAKTYEAISQATNEYQNGSWPKVHPIVRCSVMLKAANLMLIDRNELASLIIYEAGKSISEALADVDEAIDFLNFYAREEAKLHTTRKDVRTRGVMAVISPWNFPLAIPCGMVSSALLAGNCVILKSARHTPLIAQRMVELLHQAGVPQYALIHLPGSGATIGNILVDHQDINGVVFTGSKEVGTEIYQKVSSRFQIKSNENGDEKFIIPNRVITEMGGKNAIVVTANAELDETVAGILYSAFAHAGQKCSAASRVLVDKKVSKRFIERFGAAVKDLSVGRAYEGKTYINPLVSFKDKERLQQEVKLAIAEAEKFDGGVIVDRSQEDHPANCMGPVVIEISKQAARDLKTYACKELFGPVVHVIPYDTLEEAIEIVNCTEYALTSGIFSQSQDDIDFYLSRVQAGNVYVNRPNTGARVAIEPFGGFKMSGTGPKAGSASYIKAFHIFSPNICMDDSLTKSDIEEGPDFVYNLPTPSPYRLKTRVSHFKDNLNIVLANYENIFKGTHELDKEYLKSFKDWVVDNIRDFHCLRHNNRVIPGQLSFDDYKMQKGRGVLLAFKAVPSIETLINFYSAIILGSGILIVARNRSAYQSWSNFVNELHKCGFPKGTLKIYFPAEIMFGKLLKTAGAEFFIVDSDIDDYEIILKQIFQQDNFINRKFVPPILTPFDSLSMGVWEDFLEQFVNKRSMAINTMRHGAPMEISL